MAGANCKSWPLCCRAGNKRAVKASLESAHSEMKNVIQTQRKRAQKEEDRK